MYTHAADLQSEATYNIMCRLITGNRLAAETALYLSTVLLGVLRYTTLGYGLDHGHGESSGYVDYALV